ncbi:PD-(D/E)XK nuclease family protein [Mesorhizobium sp. f-mel]
MVLARTRPFQPSRLALVARCALRYVKETEPSAERFLPPDLRTLFGRAVHDIIEQGVAADGDVRTALIDHVMHALQALDAPLPRWAIRHGLPPSNIVQPSALAGWVRFARLSRSDAGGHGDGGTARAPAMFGREILLDDPRHDLAGRADRVDNGGVKTVVTDFKTGGLRLEVGGDHRVQLLAYGLLVAERDKRSVELVAISPTETNTLVFDAAARAEIESILLAARDRLPRGVELKPETLATPGKICLGCRYRLTCPVYPAWAERHWRDPTMRTPFDVWGQVLRVELRNDLAALVVVAPDGSLARVKGVPFEPAVEPPRPGMPVRLLSLVSSERGGGGGRPVNFVAVDLGRLAGSAWGVWVDLRSFGDPSPVFEPIRR